MAGFVAEGVSKLWALAVSGLGVDSLAADLGAIAVGVDAAVVEFLGVMTAAVASDVVAGTEVV